MSAFCSTARLLDSTRLALRAFLFYLLVAFGRHALHTHSVPRVVSRHSVITRCPTVVVTVVAASCGRARDSMDSVGAVARCVVAARLPPSIISVTVQHRITVQCSAMQCTVQHRSALHRRIQQMVSVS